MVEMILIELDICALIFIHTGRQINYFDDLPEEQYDHKSILDWRVEAHFAVWVLWTIYAKAHYRIWMFDCSRE